MSSSWPWTGLFVYLVWTDIRRPSVSELATTEVGALRREVESLRRTLADLDQVAIDLDWNRWWLQVCFRLLVLTWLSLAAWVVVPWLRGFRVRVRVPLAIPDRENTVGVEGDTPSSRTSTTIGSAALRARPVRPSDLRRGKGGDGGSDVGHS